jgi:trimeric autotransporter adhesin
LNSPQEIWVTDGTTANTTKLINYTYSNTTSTSFAVVGDRLFFINSDATNGAELWTSDGTIAGTQIVKDIQLGSNGSTIGNMVAQNSQLIFTANDGVNGQEFWKSDGTNANTNMIANLNPSGSIFPNAIYNFNNETYFNNSANFYKTDGNSITNLATLTGASSYTIVNNTLYFTGYTSAAGQELWKTNGTPSGTLLVADIKVGSASSFVNLSQTNKPLGKIGNNLLFAADNGTNGTELWITDGTTTSLLKEITAGNGSSYFGNFYETGNKIFFASEGTNGTRELWVSDGNSTGTQRVMDINPSLDIKNTYPLLGQGNDFLFVAYNINTGYEPYKYETATNNISLLKDIVTIPRTTVASWQKSNGSLVLGNKAFFFVDDSEHGNELWVSDATTAGTYLLKDFTPYDLYYYTQGQRINPNYKPGSFLSGWTIFNNEIIMIVNYREIWKVNENLVFTQLYAPNPSNYG